MLFACPVTYKRSNIFITILDKRLDYRCDAMQRDTRCLKSAAPSRTQSYST